MFQQESLKDLEKVEAGNYRVIRGRPNLFLYSTVGYFVGLLAAFIGNAVSGHPQPALIYLVHGVLLSMCVSAYQNKWLNDVWNGPFKVEQSH